MASADTTGITRIMELASFSRVPTLAGVAGEAGLAELVPDAVAPGSEAPSAGDALLAGEEPALPEVADGLRRNCCMALRSNPRSSTVTGVGQVSMESMVPIMVA